ncbi:MAG: NAD(+) synthase [Betaproteobacteria bacterium]|nr:NAD(+) synthase [Betaproteobacteria bacterium]
MSFFNLYQHNFVRLAVAVPEVRVADPAYNAARSVELMKEAAAQRGALVLFPELGLTAYSCEDLFHQQALLDGALAALESVRKASENIFPVCVLGLPVRVEGLLFNCAAVVHRGRILGVVPKTYLPGYREFYELRHFARGDVATVDEIQIGKQCVPFGARLVFRASDQPLFAFAIELCEDLWTPIPPSSFAALAGATVLLNLSASNITIGKDRYRSELVANQSGRCLAAYLYSAAGFGESTTDMAWDGHGMIYENGVPLAQTERYAYRSQLISADVDLDRIAQDRMRQTSFGQAVDRHRDEVARFRTIEFQLDAPSDAVLPLKRAYERFPYVPSDPATRDERCREVYEIQVQGLVKRLRSIGSSKVVIGVSGGLDSTQALLVCARAMDVMGLPRKNILAYTMPGFATSERTLKQARQLMKGIGASAAEIDIKPSCMQMLRDIDHPFARGRKVFDITFENVQAGERTSHLFRLANLHNAPVVGTGDLSELALGWSTYGVGDQMAHYAVNASVPKTLIRFLIRHAARTNAFGREVGRALEAVAGTAISPELIPGDRDGQPAQESEASVGPYEIQDFHLYYTLRFGYLPRKVAFLAWNAWRDKSAGNWPETPEDARCEYGVAEIRKWLGVFLKRFFQSSQYKRSAMPNGPKVGSGGSLSPRSDYRAPSDSEATAWLADLENVPLKEPVSGRRKSESRR